MWEHQAEQSGSKEEVSDQATERYSPPISVSTKRGVSRGGAGNGVPTCGALCPSKTSSKRKVACSRVAVQHLHSRNEARPPWAFERANNWNKSKGSKLLLLPPISKKRPRVAKPSHR